MLKDSKLGQGQQIVNTRNRSKLPRTFCKKVIIIIINKIKGKQILDHHTHVKRQSIRLGLANQQITKNREYLHIYQFANDRNRLGLENQQITKNREYLHIYNIIWAMEAEYARECLNIYLKRFRAAFCYRNTWTPCDLALSFCTSKRGIDHEHIPKTYQNYK